MVGKKGETGQCIDQQQRENIRTQIPQSGTRMAGNCKQWRLARRLKAPRPPNGGGSPHPDAVTPAGVLGDAKDALGEVERDVGQQPGPRCVVRDVAV